MVVAPPLGAQACGVRHGQGRYLRDGAVGPRFRGVPSCTWYKSIERSTQSVSSKNAIFETVLLDLASEVCTPLSASLPSQPCLSATATKPKRICLSSTIRNGMLITHHSCAGTFSGHCSSLHCFSSQSAHLMPANSTPVDLHYHLQTTAMSVADRLGRWRDSQCTWGTRAQTWRRWSPPMWASLWGPMRCCGALPPLPAYKFCPSCRVSHCFLPAAVCTKRSCLDTFRRRVTADIQSQPLVSL